MVSTHFIDNPVLGKNFGIQPTGIGFYEKVSLENTINLPLKESHQSPIWILPKEAMMYCEGISAALVSLKKKHNLGYLDVPILPYALPLSESFEVQDPGGTPTSLLWVLVSLNMVRINSGLVSQINMEKITSP